MRRHLLTSVVMLIGLTVVLGFGYPLLVTGLSALFFRHQADGSLLYRHGKLVGSSLLGQNFTDSKGSPMPGYFQPRPSAAGPGYDGADSGASNLGPSNPLLIGFVPGVNTVGLAGRPSAVNPFATKADPACVPTDPQGNPVTSPAPGQRYARNPDGSYVCDPSTIPERAIAYRAFNGLPASAPVPIDAVTASGSGLDPDISAANALDQAPRVARARHLPLGQVISLVHHYTSGRQLGFLGEPTVNVVELNLALDGLR
ncbi:MAG: potassium-transporting ATPase subunit C [Streptosporangiaceae bacterium]|jgi:K+-transporting ATPase ATPase C chain|nr:potassium-transporting ATPase subunit C [Actinomycetota bacterium]